MRLSIKHQKWLNEGSKRFGCRYWSNGCQIIPPHDANIAASILSNLEPISWDENLVYQENGFVEQIYARVFRLYCLAVTRAIPGVIPEAIPEVNLKAIEKMEKNQLKTIENQLKAIDKNQLKAIEKNQRCFPVSVHEPAKVSPLPSTYLRDLLKDRIRFVYTPMHGVGSKYMGEVAKKLHLDEGMVVVSEQVELISSGLTSSAKDLPRLHLILTFLR